MIRNNLLCCLLAVTSALATTHAFAAIDPPAPEPVPGSFDSSFAGDGNGRVTGLQITVEGPDHLSVTAVQADRKIFAAGGCGLVARFCIARLHGDGSIDESFTGDAGARGKFTLNVGVAGFESFVSAIAVQPDGKLLLAGQCKAQDRLGDACIARLLPDGRLDPSFVGPGGNARGAFVLPISGVEDSVTALLVQADGRIVLLGSCLAADNVRRSCGARLLADGTLDSSFGGPAGTGNGRFVHSLSGDADHEISARLQSDQRIVIASVCYNDPQAPGVPRACVTRLDGNGRFDASFNIGATPGRILHISIGAVRFVPASLAVQPDGKLVLLGSCVPATAQPLHLCLIRYLPEGVADRSFVGPKRSGFGSFAMGVTGATAGAIAQQVAVQADGKLIISGRCSTSTDSPVAELCVARLHGDGTLDTSFDGPTSDRPGDGSFMVPLGLENIGPPALAIQPDGQIVHGYYCQLTEDAPARMCVSRIHGGPRPVAQCSLDVDGDGVAGSATDLLILTRATLGFTGDAVRASIGFAPSATRTSWTTILKFLKGNCGMPLSDINPET